MITTLAVAGYRSLREVVVPLGGLDVVTGPNGAGKSSLYRALRLLADIAAGRAIASLAHEGGLPSVLWAGPETLSGARRRGAAVEGLRRTGPVSLRLGFASADGLSYLVDLGLPGADSRRSAFALDPEIKREVVWAGPVARPGSVLVDRRGPLVRARVGRDWTELTSHLPSYSSMLTDAADPSHAPELVTLRETMRSWRFYDGFRTDSGAPVRSVQVGTRTPVLAGDGHDLAAALQTILEAGRGEELAAAFDDAFPGGRVRVEVTRAQFEVLVEQPGMLRPMRLAELSDGTVRYLLLTAALLSPSPAPLVVLNEPETSLHPDLLAPLARLVDHAAAGSQLVVVTHSARLAKAFASAGRLRLARDLGETVVEGQGRLDVPAWDWGHR